MSESYDLCWSNVVDIVDRLGLDEVLGDDGGEYLVLRSAMMPEPVGTVRVFRGQVTLVYVGMVVAPIGLDSHMMFAFTPSGSAVPHYTVDSVQNPEAYAFHLDLIPRLDLGANLGYMDHCYGPLTDLRRTALEIQGMTPADLSPRQWALMSEWMLANHTTAEAFEAIRPTVDSYREHWLSLIAAGVPAELLDDADADSLARRDERNRAAIFNPDVDRVWERVEQLLGPEQSESVRRLLAAAGAEAVQG
jgi:hypothetical protein